MTPGDDKLYGDAGVDILLGDHGVISQMPGTSRLFSTANVTRVETARPGEGGNDEIHGGSESDIILGGFGNDTLYGDDGTDVLLGDNGFVDTVVNDGNPTTIDQIRSTDPTLGGNDTIHAGSGDDIVFGGTGNDTIFGDDGSDILLGDAGFWSSALPASQRFQSIYISAADGGGNDEIHGGAGDDFILGQQGNDLIYGDAGQDDLIGGHNVLYGADGNDTIYGGDGSNNTAGDGADVVLGDNGQIVRHAIVSSGTAIQYWETYTGAFTGVVIRDIVRFDNIDRVGGNDTLFGDNGQDILLGQRGDDTLDGGAGDDELIGGLGNDTLHGGDGRDVLLGDEGTIVRTFNADGTPKLNSDGSWHRDIVLEDYGTVTGTLEIGEHAAQRYRGRTNTWRWRKICLARTW